MSLYRWDGQTMTYKPRTEPVTTLQPGDRFVTVDVDGERRHYLVMATGLVRMLPRVKDHG